MQWVVHYTTLAAIYNSDSYSPNHTQNFDLILVTADVGQMKSEKQSYCNPGKAWRIAQQPLNCRYFTTIKLKKVQEIIQETLI